MVALFNKSCVFIEHFTFAKIAFEFTANDYFIQLQHFVLQKYNNESTFVLQKYQNEYEYQNELRSLCRVCLLSEIR